MFTVELIDNISPEGLKQFDPEWYTLQRGAQHPDVLLVRSTKLHDYVFSPNLLAVARAGAGTDNIPVHRLSQLGVPVFYAPGANANAVKELVLAAMLMGYRHLDETREFIKGLSQDDNQRLHQDIEAQKKKFVGHEISGKTLGVIGLGSIGVKVANMALALGMRVMGFDSNITINNALALVPGIEKVLDMNLLLQRADIISIHVPLLEETIDLIHEKNIHLCKPDVLFLNFSREQIVNEQAILQLLESRTRARYLTDFPTVRLVQHPQVICYPHLGASTLEAEQCSAEMVIRNVRNFLEYGSIEHAVNFPNIALSPLASEGIQRFIIMHHNIPSALSDITKTFSDAGANIAQMENKSRDALAVTLIDISGTKINTSQLADVLRAEAGVMGIRQLGL